MVCASTATYTSNVTRKHVVVRGNGHVDLAVHTRLGLSGQVGAGERDQGRESRVAGLSTLGASSEGSVASSTRGAGGHGGALVALRRVAVVVVVLACARAKNTAKNCSNDDTDEDDGANDPPKPLALLGSALGVGCGRCVGVAAAHRVFIMRRQEGFGGSVIVAGAVGRRHGGGVVSSEVNARR